jgi:DNA-binding CsgD family transcriptional regulator
MAVLRSAGAPTAPLAWLIEAVAANYSDKDVSDLLDEGDERKARAVLPAGFFGWLAAEAEFASKIVSDLNDGDSRVPYREVARAAARMLTEFAYRLMRDDPGGHFLELPFRFAAPAARLGIESAVVIQSVRITERRWVDQLLAAAGDRAGDVAPSVLSASAAIYDAVVDSFVADYVLAQAQLDGEALAAKRALIDALLQPGVGDAAALEDLGVDPSNHHVAVVLWNLAAGGGPHLDAAARHIVMRAPARSWQSVPGDNRAVWVWLSFAEDPSRDALDRVRSIPRDPNRVGLALGPVATGVHGFRKTHLLAREYAAVAGRLPSGSTPVVADAESVSFLSLLLSDRERAEWFVGTELGALGSGSSASDRENRETLRIYLETGQSLADTALRLRIHRNTVVYRLKRIEQAIGRPIVSRRHELYAAALLAHLLEQPES